MFHTLRGPPHVMFQDCLYQSMYSTWLEEICIDTHKVREKRDVCTIFPDSSCCIGQENRKGRGPFLEKRRHDDRTRIHVSKKGHNNNMLEEICLLLLKRRLSTATSGCHSKVNCRGREQWQSVWALKRGRKVQKMPILYPCFCQNALLKRRKIGQIKGFAGGYNYTWWWTPGVVWISVNWANRVWWGWISNNQ